MQIPGHRVSGGIKMGAVGVAVSADQDRDSDSDSDKCREAEVGLECVTYDSRACSRGTLSS